MVLLARGKVELAEVCRPLADAQPFAAALPPPPPGGVGLREHGARLEVADGVLAVWSTTSSTGTAIAGEMDAFCAAAAAAIARATAVPATA